MNDHDTFPEARRGVACVYFTCVKCGTVEEVHVPLEEGLPAKFYWECHGCQMQADDDRRKKIA